MSGCTFPVCIFLMNPIYPTEYPDYLELDTHMHIVLSVFSIVNSILLDARIFIFSTRYYSNFVRTSLCLS